MNPEQQDPKQAPLLPGKEEVQTAEPPETTIEQEQTPETVLQDNKQTVKGTKTLFVLLAIIVAAAIGLAVYRFTTEEPPAAVEPTIDEQLEQDLNLFGAALNEYIDKNDEFKITDTSVAELRISYLPQDMTDPRTNQPYVISQQIPQTGDIQYVQGSTCEPDGSLSAGGNAASYAARLLLEDGSYLCIEPDDVRANQTPDS